MVCVASAVVLFFGNDYAPIEGVKLVHWLRVLGFTLAICRNVVLKGRDSIALDNKGLSTVQPNLQRNYLYCRNNKQSLLFSFRVSYNDFAVTSLG